MTLVLIFLFIEVVEIFYKRELRILGLVSVFRGFIDL